jgi:hypothetical protein
MRNECTTLADESNVSFEMLRRRREAVIKNTAVFHKSPLLPTAVITTCIHSVTILTVANLLETPLFFL